MGERGLGSGSHYQIHVCEVSSVGNEYMYFYPLAHFTSDNLAEGWGRQCF